MDKNSTKNVIIVVFVVSFVCALLVSSVSVAFREAQKQNEIIKKWSEILEVLQIPYADKSEVAGKFESDVKAYYFDVATGNLLTKVPTAAELDPKLNYTALTPEQDVAKIFRRNNISVAYVSYDEAGKIKKIALPVSGYGLWSVMYAYLALEPDLNSISGVSFYKHAETPGLGGEIANPKWTAKWAGKQVQTDKGFFEVIKGAVRPGNPDENRQVDGIAGSTLTSNGVSNMMKFWFGDDGYGKFIAKLKSGEISLKRGE